MTITTKVLVAPKQIETTQTAQYTANGCTAIIDKCTVTNTSTSNAVFSINLLQPSPDSATSSNLIIKSKNLAPNETYTCPEIIGHAIVPSGVLSTIATSANALTLRVSGREIT